MNRVRQLPVGLAAFGMMVGLAHGQTLNWGMEATQCGNNQFYITAGNGSNIYLNSISGIVSGTSVAPDTTTERQVLMSLAGNTPTNGTVVSNPSLPGYEHEVDRGLYVVDLKQVGTDVVHVPFSVHFTKPILIPGGSIAVNMFVATYDAVGTPLAGPCLDAEAHLQFVWQTTP